MGVYETTAAAGLPDVFTRSRQQLNNVRKVAQFVAQFSKASHSKVAFTPLYP